jgi:type I restriction enzyme M protein
MFFNTGIATYIWVLSNHKSSERKGKVQLINATGFGEPMRKSLGSKRKQLTDESIDTITRLYGAFEAGENVKIFDTTDFGFRRITVERPLQLSFYPTDQTRIAALSEDKAFIKLSDELKESILATLATLDEKISSRDTFVKALGVRLTAAQIKLLQKHLAVHDEEAEICRKAKKPEPNPDLRDYENIPLKEDIYDYFKREVTPHVPDAWIDEKKVDAKDGEIGIVGYEIPFNRHFYKYVPPRELAEIDSELDAVTADILELLNEVKA